MKFHPYGFFGGLRFGGIWKGGRGRVRGISRCQKCSGISRNLGFLFPSRVPIGCLGGRSDGAVFSISPVTVGDKYMDIYSWKTLSNKSRLKDLCFKRRIITVCNGTKRGFHFGTEVGW